MEKWFLFFIWGSSMKQLHVISTGLQTIRELTEIVSFIHPYIDYIHLREKHWTAQMYVHCIDQLITIGVSKEKIIINDRVDVAAVTNVYGVQLPGHSLSVEAVKQTFPFLKIGSSVHSVKEAKEKEQSGANRLIFGHIFPSTSKKGLPAQGLNKLEKVVQQVKIPVIAIGGITPCNVESVCQTGAAGIAVLSGILLAENPHEAAKEYRGKLDLFKEGI